MGWRFAIGVLVLLWAGVAFGQTVPPDVVRLRDGTFLRGTIVEQSPTQLVVLLPTGETRTYPASEVASAAPQDPPSQQLAAPAPVVVMPQGPPLATVHVRSDQPNLSLQRLQGTTTVSVSTYSVNGGVGYGSAQVDQYAVLCNAPCEVQVPEGAYQLGVAQGGGGAQRAGGPVELRGDVQLQLHYDDRTGFRVAGWVFLGVGLATGLGMMIPALFQSGDDYTLLIAGVSVACGAALLSMIFTLMGDGASIETAAEGVRF